jgi:hypothetical protein
VPVPVDLWSVLLIALLNPVVPVVAFWMGRNADQAQKLLVAAFAAALAGAVLIYIVVWLGVAGAVPATAWHVGPPLRLLGGNALAFLLRFQTGALKSLRTLDRGSRSIAFGRELERDLVERLQLPAHGAGQSTTTTQLVIQLVAPLALVLRQAVLGRRACGLRCRSPAGLRFRLIGQEAHAGSDCSDAIVRSARNGQPRAR